MKRYRCVESGDSVNVKWRADSVVLTCRSPDDAPVRQKMVYASSKDALRKQLVGIAAEIQATSYDEITYEAGKWNMTRKRLLCR